MIYKRIHKTYTDIHAIQMSAMFPFVPLGILKLAISFLGTKVKKTLSYIIGTFLRPYCAKIHFL